MTTPATDDPLPRDPRFDTAWRAASSEAPPPALDAAILAAARREVGARPQSFSAQSAMRARRRWWPLAAAATVAVIAIGVVERAGHDDLVAPPSGSAVVSDMPAQPGKNVAEPAKRAAEAPAPASAPRDAAPGVSGAVSTEARARGDSGVRQEPLGSQSGSRAEASRRAVSGETAPLQKKALPIAGAPAPPEKKSESVRSAPPSLPEPFPAAKTEPGQAAARDEAAAPAGEPAGGIEAVPAPPPPAAPPMERAPAAIAPAASFAEGGRLGASAPARPSPAARSALGGASQETRSKDRAPLPVADWIALIRRLRAEGNTAEAARELAAFRAAHADHEKLLPPDLRDWHPTAR
jgi:hypothetical protein